MVKKGFYTLLIVSLSLVYYSCSTGKKSFERGDYYGASLQAVQRLRSNPDSKTARSTLEQSYPFALEFYQNQINAAMLLDDPLKYSRIVDYYGRLNSLADEIDRSPAAKSVIPNARRFYTEMAQARRNGAEERYQLGLAALKVGTREAARDAYIHFFESNRFENGYKDVNNLMFKSKDMATLKVLLEQIPVSGYTNEISSEFFYNQIMEHLRKNRSTEFVRFMTPQELDSEQKQPDQYLRMKFEEFVMGQVSLS